MDKAKLAAQLVVDEGKHTRIYVDTMGKVTGGVGRNLTDRSFSEDEIQLMLRNDIASAERDLDTHVSWWRRLSDARQNVMANMVFNMGIQRFLGFQHMLAALEAGDYAKAAMEMQASAWAAQVGARATRLANAMRNDTF